MCNMDLLLNLVFSNTCPYAIVIFPLADLICDRLLTSIVISLLATRSEGCIRSIKTWRSYGLANASWRDLALGYQVVGANDRRRDYARIKDGAGEEIQWEICAAWTSDATLMHAGAYVLWRQKKPNKRLGRRDQQRILHKIIVWLEEISSTRISWYLGHPSCRTKLLE